MIDLPQNKLNVALVQMTSVDDINKNVELVGSLLKTVDTSKIDLVCLPEIALYCPFPQDRDLDDFNGVKLSDPALLSLQQYCEGGDLAMCIGSVPLREGAGKLLNATIVLRPGQEPEVAYRKIHLFDVDIDENNSIRESDLFIKGEQPEVFTWKTWKFGLSICYDLRFAELYQVYRTQGAHAFLIPAAFTVPTGKAHWEILLRARAIESQVYVLAAAQSGEHNSRFSSKRYSYGHSMVVDPWGKIQAEVEEPGPGLVVVELDPQALKVARSRIPMENHRSL